ncbi:MAG: hypothetical protein QOD50_1986, partial [Actinomycetota bacterium]|nr:hypothetical protein [Actinomycetota bacterium]
SGNARRLCLESSDLTVPRPTALDPGVQRGCDGDDRPEGGEDEGEGRPSYREEHE